jgi:hypothetical protein
MLQWVTPTRIVEQPAENEQAQIHRHDNTNLRVKQRAVRSTGEGSCQHGKDNLQVKNQPKCPAHTARAGPGRNVHHVTEVTRVNSLEDYSCSLVL